MSQVTNITTTTGTNQNPESNSGQYYYSNQNMSSTMKTYYDTELLENARPRLIFSQLGKKQFLPANHGTTVEWRKWNTFEKATTPLMEGSFPTGKQFGQSAVSVDVRQYGDYAAISDRLNLHAVDNVLLGAAEEMGAAGGETADTLVRNELVTGTSVMYADTLDANGQVTGTPTMRPELLAANNRLTPDMVNKAYTFLKKQKAPFFDGGKYVAVIHPSVAYDLRSSRDWLEVHKYSQAHEIFNGEIGELHGVRFIETTEAPVFVAKPLKKNGSVYTLNVTLTATPSSTTYANYGSHSAVHGVPEVPLNDTDAVGLLRRMVALKKDGVFVGTAKLCGISNSSTTAANNKLYLDSVDSSLVGSQVTLYPLEGTGDSQPCAVYGTLFFGKDAFGVVDPEGMGMEMIIKDASQIGGPLNQFSTVGYKFESGTKILYQNRMVRVESCSAYSTVDEEN